MTASSPCGAAQQDGSPRAKERDRSGSEILTAAALPGDLFGGVKPGMDRAAATGFARVTWTWPGKTSDDD